MIITVSEDKDKTLGGVEIFNSSLEELLVESDVLVHRERTRIKDKFASLVVRYIKTLVFCLLNYKRIDKVIVHYGCFYSVLLLPILFPIKRKVCVIPHIGDTWKHIKNKGLCFITNLLLNCFCNKVFIIGKAQSSFLKHKNMQLVHTIIDRRYKELPKKNNNNDKVIYLGRICVEKGVEDLIQAYFYANKVTKCPPLELYGPIEESYKLKVEDLIKKLGLYNLAKICTPIYDVESKVELIDSSTFMVYPSYADAFPLSVLESYCRNVPCIATKIADTKYFINDDLLMYQPGDVPALTSRILNLITHPEIVSKSVECLNKKALKYTCGNIVKDIIE